MKVIHNQNSLEKHKKLKVDCFRLKLIQNCGNEDLVKSSKVQGTTPEDKHRCVLIVIHC